MNFLSRLIGGLTECRPRPASVGGVGRAEWRRGERAWLLGFAGLVVTATLVPVRQNWRPKERRVDGFPLSYYPMFSKRRRATAKIAYGVGRRADGTRRFLPLNVLGEGGHNQVRHQVYRAAVREKRPEDCLAFVLSRLPEHPELADLTRVEIVLGEFDLDACMLARRADGNETVLAFADLGTTGVPPVLSPSPSPSPSPEVTVRASA